MLRYQQGRVKGRKVKIAVPLRPEAGHAILCTVLRAGFRVLVIAVSQKHAHVLVELPRSRKVVKQIVGKWKAARTTKLRRAMRGSIWGEGGKYKPVKNREHLRAAYKYIRDDQGAGAWVWDYRNGVPEEVRAQLERDAKRARTPNTMTPKPRAQRSEAPDSSRSEKRRPRGS